MTAVFNNIAIIGAGRIAWSVAGALKNRNAPPAYVISRNAESAEKLARFAGTELYSDKLTDLTVDTDLIILSVPDDEIRNTAEKLAMLNFNFKALTVIHLSGARTIQLLTVLRKSGAQTGAIHIMQTFPNRSAVPLADLPAGIEADSEHVSDSLTSFAEELGLKPFKQSSDTKLLFHAAGVFVSNFLISNLYNAECIFKEAETGEASFSDIYLNTLQTTMRNALQKSAAAALSGPVIRGDLHTIKEHVEAVKRISSREEKLIAGSGLLESYILQSLTLLEVSIKRNPDKKTIYKDIEKYLKAELELSKQKQHF